MAVCVAFDTGGATALTDALLAAWSEVRGACETLAPGKELFLAALTQQVVQVGQHAAYALARPEEGVLTEPSDETARAATALLAGNRHVQVTVREARVVARVERALHQAHTPQCVGVLVEPPPLLHSLPSRLFVARRTEASLWLPSSRVGRLLSLAAAHNDERSLRRLHRALMLRVHSLLAYCQNEWLHLANASASDMVYVARDMLLIPVDDLSLVCVMAARQCANPDIKEALQMAVILIQSV